jgi:hypothetical protein
MSLEKLTNTINDFREEREKVEIESLKALKNQTEK